MQKTRVYLSGAITSDKNFEESFKRARKKVGENCFDPSQLYKALPGGTWQEYMDICMLALSKCGKIYMLKGFEKSKGAMQELKFARSRGMSIEYESDNNQESKKTNRSKNA